MYELNNRGVELSIIGKLDEAIEVFTQALISSPSDFNLLFNISLVYIKKCDYQRALEYLLKTVEMKECDENLREIGVCYIKLKKYSEARKYLEVCLDRFSSSESENVMGVCLFLSAQYTEARIHFEKAVKLDPWNRDAWFNLSDTFMELGMKREAKMAKYKYKLLENK